MFSGIIETKGKIVGVTPNPKGVRLQVRPVRKMKDVRIGQSVAVNGVCLTAIKLRKGDLSFDVIPETLKVTNLSALRPGSFVNLERSLRYGDRIDGHYVLGHVEGKGPVTKISGGKKGVVFGIKCPKRLGRYVIYKGCIAIDGISLTVSKVTRQGFEVSLIPHTLEITNLGLRRLGEWVNLETDILFKRGRAFARRA